MRFGGSTYHGEFFNIEQNRGKVTAIVYWSSNIGGISTTLKNIDAIAQKFSESQLEVVGVSLDDEELPLEVALGDAAVNWKQMFDPDPAKRSWNHPVVKYYGVLNVPSIWLVNQDGIVVSVNTSETDLEEQLSKLMQ
ncbi:MAG: thioredoxin-like domain-containing protein [Planctomycetaceae bacterium]